MATVHLEAGASALRHDPIFTTKRLLFAPPNQSAIEKLTDCSPDPLRSAISERTGQSFDFCLPPGSTARRRTARHQAMNRD